MDGEKWVPIRTGRLPKDKEHVQVTYIGFNDKKPYCNEFAYRKDGKWYWSSDDGNVLVDITAWKYNCKPYIEEETTMNKQDFLNYIIDYAVCTGWEDCHGKDQIRALFTSWCLIFHIDADTKECDEALNVIYWRAAMEELIEYEDYERFMIEFIV